MQRLIKQLRVHCLQCCITCKSGKYYSQQISYLCPLPCWTLTVRVNEPHLSPLPQWSTYMALDSPSWPSPLTTQISNDPACSSATQHGTSALDSPRHTAHHTLARLWSIWSGISSPSFHLTVNVKNNGCFHFTRMKEKSWLVFHLYFSENHGALVWSHVCCVV